MNVLGNSRVISVCHSEGGSSFEGEDSESESEAECEAAPLEGEEAAPLAGEEVAPSGPTDLGGGQYLVEKLLDFRVSLGVKGGDV